MMAPQSSPSDPIAQYQHALALHEAGRLEEAAALYRAMLAQFPGNPLLMTGLGAIALQQGRMDEGVAQLQASLRIEPEQPLALSNLGMALRALGRLEEALACLDRAAALAPEFAEAFSQRGIVLHDLQRLDEALASYDRAVALDPASAPALNNRGVTLQELNRLEEALASFDQAIALNPGAADIHSNRARVLRDLGRLDESLSACDWAIQLDPEFADAYLNRGGIRLGLSDLQGALADYQRAAALRPGHAESHARLGFVLQRLNRFEEAISSFDRAIALKPDYADAYTSRGIVQKYLRRYDAALASHEQAIALDPGCAAAYWNEALLKLLLGDYEAGWRLYEWRWQGGQKDAARHFVQPLWLGETSIAGKTLLIHPEQGFGDFIQCCRYIPLAEALGARVVVETFSALVPLIATLKGNLSVVPSGQPLPHFDFHCPVMSLPLAFRTTVETIPASVPYLFADAAKRLLWRQRLGPKAGMRVGIAWSGNPVQQDNHNRSIPVGALAPLFALPVEWHVLQKGAAADDAAALSAFRNVHMHEDELVDFSDTAALAAEMDLVISVCTSVAHLAGALGRPLWVLLSYTADWRWFVDRTDSPWYPSATLFRQPAIGDWPAVIAAVTRHLQAELGGKP